MNSEVKLAKMAIQAKREEQLFHLLNSPVIGLVGGVTAIQALYQSGAFGKINQSTTYKIAGITTNIEETDESKNARKIRDHTKTALYVILVAQALGPQGLQTIAGLGDTALKQFGGLAQPALPLLKSALGGL